MGRRKSHPRCQVCRDPRRAEIELAFVSRVGLDTVAERYGIHRQSVWRHMRNHLSDEDKAFYLSGISVRELADRAIAEDLSLMDYIVVVRGMLMNTLQDAAGDGDRASLAALAGKLTDLLKLSANINGDLKKLSPTTVTNNVTMFVQSPAFSELQAMLVRALSGHPEALQKVLAGLDELEAKATNSNPPMIEARPLETSDACAA